jgi:hypothetical protein
LSSQESHAHR